MGEGHVETVTLQVAAEDAGELLLVLDHHRPETLPGTIPGVQEPSGRGLPGDVVVHAPMVAARIRASPL